MKAYRDMELNALITIVGTEVLSAAAHLEQIVMDVVHLSNAIDVRAFGMSYA